MVSRHNNKKLILRFSLWALMTKNLEIGDYEFSAFLDLPSPFLSLLEPYIWKACVIVTSRRWDGRKEYLHLLVFVLLEEKKRLRTFFWERENPSGKNGNNLPCCLLFLFLQEKLTLQVLPPFRLFLLSNWPLYQLASYKSINEIILMQSPSGIVFKPLAQMKDRKSNHGPALCHTKSQGRIPWRLDTHWEWGLGKCSRGSLLPTSSSMSGLLSFSSLHLWLLETEQGTSWGRLTATWVGSSC